MLKGCNTFHQQVKQSHTSMALNHYFLKAPQLVERVLGRNGWSAHDGFDKDFSIFTTVWRHSPALAGLVYRLNRVRVLEFHIIHWPFQILLCMLRRSHLIIYDASSQSNARTTAYTFGNFGNCSLQWQFFIGQEGWLYYIYGVVSLSLYSSI